MRIEARNSESGATVTAEVPEISDEDLLLLTKEVTTDEQLDRLLDKIELSADAKALLSDLKTTSIKVGEHVVRIGKRILEIILAIIKQLTGQLINPVNRRLRG